MHSCWSAGRRVLTLALLVLSVFTSTQFLNPATAYATPAETVPAQAATDPAAIGSHIVYLPLVFGGSGTTRSLPIPTGRAYYVATTGNDANPGTEAQPWRTIAKAAATVGAGQAVYIKQGTYAEKLRPARSGSSGSWILFSAYSGHTVILDGSQFSVGTGSALVDLQGRSYIGIRGLTVRNSSNVGILTGGSQHIVLQGNHTLNSNSSGIGIWSSTDVVVENNDVENSNRGGGNEAISVSGTGTFEIRDNKVHNPIASSTLPCKEGIDIKEGSHDGSVHHNEIFQIEKPSLYVDALDKHTYNIEIYANRIHDVKMGITLASELGGLLENVKVYNNVVWNAYYAGIRTFGQVDTASHPMRNIAYTNNTVYKSGVGINVSNEQISGFLVENNVLSQNGTALQLAANVTGVTIVRNLQDRLLSDKYSVKGSTDILGAPAFVDPAALNFRLRAGSPAIDRGQASGAPAVDADGRSRPQGSGYDIGAYEYAGY